jgi:hypothetical protein
MRGYLVIDDHPELIDSNSNLIDDPDEGFPLVLPQLGAVGGDVVKASDALLKYDGTAFAQLVETFDFFFETIGQVNEITKVLLEYIGSGSPNIQVFIGTRANQSQTISWSAAVDIDRSTNSSLNFFHRQKGVGKFIRFRFTWGNTGTNNATELRLLSLHKVENTEDAAPEE